MDSVPWEYFIKLHKATVAADYFRNSVLHRLLSTECFEVTDPVDWHETSTGSQLSPFECTGYFDGCPVVIILPECIFKI